MEDDGTTAADAPPEVPPPPPPPTEEQPVHTGRPPRGGAAAMPDSDPDRGDEGGNGEADDALGEQVHQWHSLDPRTFPRTNKGLGSTLMSYVAVLACGVSHRHYLSI